MAGGKNYSDSGLLKTAELKRVEAGGCEEEKIFDKVIKTCTEMSEHPLGFCL